MAFATALRRDAAMRLDLRTGHKTMQLMKKILNLYNWQPSPQTWPIPSPRFTGGDPLDHPDIQAMDERQLADLPPPDFSSRTCAH
jgi:hypothetical protein